MTIGYRASFIAVFLLTGIISALPQQSVGTVEGVVVDAVTVKVINP